MKPFRIILSVLLLSASLFTLYADNKISNFIKIETEKNKESKQQGNSQLDSDDKRAMGTARATASPFLEKALKRRGDTSPATERYYANVIRQYGWLTGFGKPLSKAEAEKLGHYYRLSNKNSKGRWQRVEYVGNGTNSYKDLQMEFLSSLIFINSPIPANKELISEAVSWEFLSDPTGALMIEERGFDADGKLLYMMNSTEYSEGKLVLSFLNANALPMFTDRTLHVQCDPQGRFHIVNFTDDLGYYFPNVQGVYEIHIEYSPDNYRYINCNIAGNPL